jgi:uncharacterized membrane protein YeaQ/YmgE (transglycosylase-associated protein family)
VKRCDAILTTAIGCAILGALAGAVLANGAMQMLVYAVLGVWGGAIAGGLLGALRCSLARERLSDDAGAGRDGRLEPSKKLRPVGP